MIVNTSIGIQITIVMQQSPKNVGGKRRKETKQNLERTQEIRRPLYKLFWTVCVGTMERVGGNRRVRTAPST